MLKLRTHPGHRTSGCLLQAVDQCLNLAGRTGGALCQRTHLIGYHGETTAHITGAGRFDGRIQCQQVGLLGNRADHRQHATDGGRLLRQLFDHAGVALHLVDQLTQA
ncbi:hypothetical protein D3C71_1832100 [compost metagenome]